MKEHNKPAVSVIVPVYNIEAYIARCVDSLLRQTFTDFELVLVDDGSTDGSGRVCEAYTRRDNRVVCLHKVNGGLSDARNYGIDHSSADLIAFVDGDDWVSADYLSHLVENKLDDVQMVCARIKTVHGDEIPRYVSNGRAWSVDPQQALAEVLSQRFFDVSANAKLYERGLFEKVRFPVGLLYEDAATAYYFITACRRVRFVDSSDYFYIRSRADSLTGSFSMRRADIIPVMDEMVSFLVPRFPAIAQVVYQKAFSALSTVFFTLPTDIENCGGNDKETRQVAALANQLWSRISRYRRHILVPAHSRLKTLLGAWLSFLGPQVYRWLGRKFLA